jgi:hypothetical protein
LRGPTMPIAPPATISRADAERQKAAEEKKRQAQEEHERTRGY